MKIVFDQNTPDKIASRLVGHEVTLARRAGWDRIGNGVLLDAAERAGFELLLTCDTNLKYQQNMAGRRIAVVQLTSNHWLSIKAKCDEILDAVTTAIPGSYQIVNIPLLPFKQRRRADE